LSGIIGFKVRVRGASDDAPDPKGGFCGCWSEPASGGNGQTKRTCYIRLFGQKLKAVFEEDLHKCALRGEVRTDDSAKHKSVITAGMDVYRWASEGLPAERIAKEKLFVSYGALHQLLKDTGRLGRFREISLSARDSVGKGGETPDFPVVKGPVSELPEREPSPTGRSPVRRARAPIPWRLSARREPLGGRPLRAPNATVYRAGSTRTP
jgi:hypothetical protein